MLKQSCWLDVVSPLQERLPTSLQCNDMASTKVTTRQARSWMKVWDSSRILSRPVVSSHWPCAQRSAYLCKPCCKRRHNPCPTCRCLFSQQPLLDTMLKQSCWLDVVSPLQERLPTSLQCNDMASTKVTTRQARSWMKVWDSSRILSRPVVSSHWPCAQRSAYLCKPCCKRRHNPCPTCRCLFSPCQNV